MPPHSTPPTVAVVPSTEPLPVIVTWVPPAAGPGGRADGGDHRGQKWIGGYRARVDIGHVEKARRRSADPGGSCQLRRRRSALPPGPYSPEWCQSRSRWLEHADAVHEEAAHIEVSVGVEGHPTGGKEASLVPSQDLGRCSVRVGPIVGEEHDLGAEEIGRIDISRAIDRDSQGRYEHRLVAIQGVPPAGMFTSPDLDPVGWVDGDRTCLEEDGRDTHTASGRRSRCPRRQRALCSDLTGLSSARWPHRPSPSRHSDFRAAVGNIEIVGRIQRQSEAAPPKPVSVFTTVPGEAGQPA